MNSAFNESIQLSQALATATRVQQIATIAAGNVRRECGGALPAPEAGMIEAFEAGLLQGRLVVCGPLGARSAGHLLAFLVDLDDEQTVRIFYEEADERVGGPIWDLLSETQRQVLLHEGCALSRAVYPLWRRHCDARASDE